MIFPEQQQINLANQNCMESFANCDQEDTFTIIPKNTKKLPAMMMSSPEEKENACCHLDCQRYSYLLHKASRQLCTNPSTAECISESQLSSTIEVSDQDGNNEFTWKSGMFGRPDSTPRSVQRLMVLSQKIFTIFQPSQINRLECRQARNF